MTSPAAELGAKISLISKADIRYEGRLYQVDPNECTIALANVRSFGTEDRETNYPVPAQSQIYEYILFRGSDIKDIRIVPPTPIHQDPAIVQSVPQPPQPQPQQQPPPQPQHALQSAGLSHQLLGQPGHHLGGFAGYGLGLQRGPGSLLMQQSELGPVVRPNEPHPGPSTLDKEQDLIGGLSRSTTPSLSRKSPTIDQGTQVNKSPPRDDNRRQPRPIQPPDRDRSRKEQPLYQPGQSGNRQPRDSDNRRPFHENNRSEYVRNDGFNRRPNYRRDNQQQDNQFQNRNQQSRQPSGDGQQGAWVQRNQNNQNRPQQTRGNRARGPGRPGSRSGGPPVNKKNPLKFEDDYDFDKANTEFEELRSQLNKLKVTTDEIVAGEPGVPLEKKEDSGNETGTGEASAGEEEKVFYNKSKSFFDSISCEAVERSKGRSQRTDWRTERKLNTETFGVSSARRGNYRGRGYYGSGRHYGYRPRNNLQNGPSDQQSNASAADALTKKNAEEKPTAPSAEAIPLPTPLVAAAS